MSFEEWVRLYVNPEMLKGENLVKVTYGAGAGKSIKEWEACFIFKPQAARGDNGVMLTEFKGIASFKETLSDFVADKFYQDTAIYPMGAPINDLTPHNLCCSCMIGKSWRRYIELALNPKWTFLGTFNTMQFFFYNSS